jgi:MEDS: MEthanogen/methylotroph, DcmR Sensory domain
MRRADQPKALPAVLAGAKHGSHICAFYETHDDLIELVLPFFTARVNRGELCVWMMPDGVSDDARVRTTATLAERGIEIVSGTRSLSTRNAFRTRAGHKILG